MAVEQACRAYQLVHHLHASQDFAHMGIVVPQAQLWPNALLVLVHGRFCYRALMIARVLLPLLQLIRLEGSHRFVAGMAHITAIAAEVFVHVDVIAVDPAAKDLAFSTETLLLKRGSSLSASALMLFLGFTASALSPGLTPKCTLPSLSTHL